MRRRIGIKLCRFCMWLALLATLLFQAFTVVGLSSALSNKSESAQGFIVGLVLACLALVAGVVLLYAVRKSPWLGLGLLVLGGCAMIFLGVALREEAGDPTVMVSGETGLTVWKMIYRHFIAVLVPLFAGGAEFLLYIEKKEQEIREMARRRRKPDEKEESTLGL